MAQAAGNHSEMYDVYDEEFNRHLLLAKSLIAQLKRKQDREICTKWIQKLIELQSNDPGVKKNRNHFFRFFLRVIHKGLEEGIEEHGGYPQYDEKYSPKAYMSRWSADRRTYVAVRPLPGKGALVYMAVAKDASLGWDIPPGFHTYK